MQTQTLTEIIDHLATTIAALTPAASPSTPGFVRATPPTPAFRSSPPDASVNLMVRLFELARQRGTAGVRTDLGLQHPTAGLVTVPLLLTVAYPAVPKLYTLATLPALEALVESDVAQLRDAIFLPTGLVGSGHLKNDVQVLGLDTADKRIWYQDLSITAMFYIAQRTP